MNKYFNMKNNFNLRDYSMIVLVVIIVGIVIFTGRKVSFVDLMLACLPQQEIAYSPNILVIGIDATSKVRRSDTIMVFKVHNHSKRVNIISIPRDSYVYVPRHGYDKINHAYAYGGIKLLQLTVEEFLNLNIYRYLRLSLNDLRYIVNVLGGVDLNVEKRMYYVDKAGGLYINLKAGSQRLNSEQAMGYIRYRHTYEGDIGRTKRQQKLIQAIFREAAKPVNIFKIPKIISNLKKRLKTDLSFKELIWLGANIKRAYDNQQLYRATLPGKEVYINGISYWEIDKVKKDLILSKALKSYTKVNNTESLRDVSLEIEVLNGNGVARSAEIMANELIKAGINVTRMDNAAHYEYAKSLLVIWYKKDKYTRMLQASLGISNRNMQIRNVEKPIYATLVLGDDWESILNNIKNNNRKGN
ncbi:LCP family protein [Candidatus Margulisiibacteriota bacterium]